MTFNPDNYQEHNANTNPSNSFGLWKRTSKNGLTYYTGSVKIDGEEYWVNIFKNAKKSKDTHPDLNLILKPKNADLIEDNEEDDEIPF